MNCSRESRGCRQNEEWNLEKEAEETNRLPTKVRNECGHEVK